MKTLFLVRHGQSSWDDVKLADRDRPLTDKGRRDATKMGKRLAEAEVTVDAIVASPAMRALATAEAIAKLRSSVYAVYAVEQAEGSIALQEFSPPSQKLALVFGNEVYGVEQEIVSAADGTIEIPQAGSKHSLNVAVSIGIVLWEVLRGKKPV